MGDDTKQNGVQKIDYEALPQNQPAQRPQAKRVRRGPEHSQNTPAPTITAKVSLSKQSQTAAAQAKEQNRLKHEFVLFVNWLNS